MLSAPDADIVRRDPDLTGLALVLDADALLEELQRHVAHATLLALTPYYVRYKPSTNCLVAYRLTTSEGTYRVYAKAHPRSAREKFVKARHRASVPGEIGIARTVLEHGAVIVAAFPNDDKLRTPKLWADPVRRRRLMRRVAPGVLFSVSSASTILRYKPERRLVARLEAKNGDVVVVRGCLPTDFERCAAGASAFQPREALRVASCVGASRGDSAIALAWLEGCSLDEALARDDAPLAMLGTVGTALAELHGQPVASLRTMAREQEVARLSAVSEAVAFLCPAVAGRVRAVFERIADRLPLNARCPIHGDFHAKQVLLHGNAAAFIDFDEAALGDPMIDVATFVAHLRRDAISGRLSDERVDACSATLIEGYRRMSDAQLDGLAVRVAAALVLLAPHPFRDREPSWRERMAAIVDRAASTLDVTPMRSTAGARGAMADTAVSQAAVQRYLTRVPRVAEMIGSRASVERLRVIKERPNRRRVIEYTMRSAVGPHESVTIIGKQHHRGINTRSYAVLERLRERGFSDTSADGVAVPEPLGMVPDLRMWLQAHAPGTPASVALLEPGGTRIARRIAEALWKLHSSDVQPDRVHTLEDETEILVRRLEEVAAAQPQHASRVARIAIACATVAARIEAVPPALIHRDFYASQVHVDGTRLWLLDFDLCCLGDPAIDAGNFLAHLIEHACRDAAHAFALASACDAFRERYVELIGGRRAGAVDAYTTLSLARHIWISTQLHERRPFTADILDLAEARLGITGPANAAAKELTR